MAKLNPFSVLLVMAAVAGLGNAIPEYASTIRPPSFPLAVRNPYTNYWLGASELPGNWPNFWTGATRGWTGMIRIDGDTWVWMGNPNDGDGGQIGTRAEQIGTFVTPTQTLFMIRAGSIDLNVTFFSPVEVEDIPRQSIPLSYVFVDVASNDGTPHDVQMYMDITGEWATSNLAQTVTWFLDSTATLKVFTTQLQEPRQFTEYGDHAEWGSALLATTLQSSHMSGSDLEVRTAFANTGALLNTMDPDFRCASCDWPTFGFAQDLGPVSAPLFTQRTEFIVGDIRDPNVNWLGEPLRPLWLDYYDNMLDMLDFFYGDLEGALETADALDVMVLNDAFAAGGQEYADILTFSVRQSYAGNEFSEGGTYFQKEISSGAFVNTVDVIYPAAPMFIYFNIDYLRLLLEPLFIQMETGVWTQPFAMHDIGAPYPNALGQAYGGDMPIEESSNMIMMVGDIAFHPSMSEADAVAYVESHYEIMEQWAGYLQENCLYPTNQLTTDDFIGPTELNSGLALKGILGIATFAKLSGLIGNTANEDLYNSVVAEFMPTWYDESIHADGDHLKMEYNVDDGYQFKYNALHDRLLNLGVVPQEVYEMEAAFYLEQMEPYGIPFCSRHDYTKSDWEMWTAAAFGEVNPALRTGLIEALGRFLQFTPQRVPFTDWYVTATSNQVGFQARPVQGGHFALLALDLMKKHWATKV